MSKIVCAVPTISSASATVASSSARRSAGAADTSGSPSTRSRSTRTPSRSTCASRRLRVERVHVAWSSIAATGTTTARTPCVARLVVRRARRPTNSSTASPSIDEVLRARKHRFVAVGDATVASTSAGSKEPVASAIASEPVSSPGGDRAEELRLLRSVCPPRAPRARTARRWGAAARARSPGRAPRRGSRARARRARCHRALRRS